MFEPHYKKVKRQFHKAAKGKMSDHRIGLSFAIGTFFAVLPISIFAILICIALAMFIRYLSKLSLLLAILFWNPLWQMALFYPAKVIGKLILEPYMDWITTLIGQIPYAEYILSLGIYYAAGMVVLAIYFSLLSYFVVRLLIKLYRLRQEKKNDLAGTH